MGGKGFGPIADGRGFLLASASIMRGPEMVEELRSIGAGAVSTDPADLELHSRDSWPLAIYRSYREEPSSLPLAVLRPASTAEVATAVRWAEERGVALVPYGGGSGVCGAVGVGESPTVVLDLRRMNRLRWLDREAWAAEAEAGMTGPELEEVLGREGFTLGHFPQSHSVSTLGGWIAASSSGQRSLKYGSIEDLILGVEAVVGGGEVLRTPPVPRTAVAWVLPRLFVGSEGSLGVVTAATLRIRPAPETRLFRAFLFPAFDAALRAVREIVQAGLRPAVLRAWDEAETSISFGTPQGSLLAVVTEGTGPRAEAEMAEASAMAASMGGTEAGEGPARKWWQEKDEAVRLLPEVLSPGGVLGPHVLVDSVEVAALWPQVLPTYTGVREALVAASTAVLCHASHPYPEGTSLYFIFVVTAGSDAEAKNRYRAAWERAVQAAHAAGATMSHHHGVGRLKLPWLAREVGEGGVRVLRALKRALDPAGVFNPGVLGGAIGSPFEAE